MRRNSTRISLKCNLHVSGVLFGATVSAVISRSAFVRAFNQFSLLCNCFHTQAVARTGRRNYGGGHHRPPTMNEMPIPEGDFMALHGKRQAGYHTVLALGLASSGFGIFLVSLKEKLFLNQKLYKLFCSTTLQTSSTSTSRPQRPTNRLLMEP